MLNFLAFSFQIEISVLICTVLFVELTQTFV